MEEANKIGIDFLCPKKDIHIKGMIGTFIYKQGLITVADVPNVKVGWYFRTYLPQFIDNPRRQSWYLITKLEPDLNSDGQLCISTGFTEICRTGQKGLPIAPELVTGDNDEIQG